MNIKLIAPFQLKTQILPFMNGLCVYSERNRSLFMKIKSPLAATKT